MRGDLSQPTPFSGCIVLLGVAVVALEIVALIAVAALIFRTN